MKHVFCLLTFFVAFAQSFATPPTTGQFLFQRKTAGPFDQFGVTPVTGQVFGWDGTNVVSYALPSGAIWGSITGTLSAQTDLQSALNLKLSLAVAATTYQPLDADLTAIAALTTDGFGRALLTKTDGSAVRSYIGAGTGSGTVTAVSVVSANGISGTSSGGATPALILTLGAITPSVVNGNIISAGTGTLTLNDGSIEIGVGSSLGLGNNSTFVIQEGNNFVVGNTITLASDGIGVRTLNIGTGGTLKALSFVTPGTGVVTALGVNIGSAGAPVLFNGAGGTPSNLTLTNATGLPVSTGISGLGTGSATALAAGVSTGGVGTGDSGKIARFAGAGNLYVTSNFGIIGTGAHGGTIDLYNADNTAETALVSDVPSNGDSSLLHFPNTPSGVVITTGNLTDITEISGLVVTGATTTTLGGASVSGTALRIVSSGGYPSLAILSGSDFVGQTIDGSAFYIQPSGSLRTQIQSNLTVTGATTLTDSLVITPSASGASTAMAVNAGATATEARVVFRIPSASSGNRVWRIGGAKAGAFWSPDSFSIDSLNDAESTVIAWVKCNGTTTEIRGLSATGDATFSNALSVSGATTLTGGIVGTATGNNATAGNVGQTISSIVPVGSAISLTTVTPANVTSISLTAGDWWVQANVNFTETVATASARSAGINITSATIPTDGSEAYCGVQSTLVTELNSITPAWKRVNVSSTTTVYLIASATFSAGTVAAFGSLIALRASR